MKMIDTILILLDQDTSSGKLPMVPKASKGVQVNTTQTEPEPGRLSVLSAREKQRLSLEERIRARKSEVQDSAQKQKDQELKSMRYEVEMLQ